MMNLKPERLHSTSSLSWPIDVTLTSTKDCGPSGASFSGCSRYRRSRASVTSFSSGKQSHTLVIKNLLCRRVDKFGRARVDGGQRRYREFAHHSMPKSRAVAHPAELWPDPRRLHLQPARAPHQVE